MNKFFSKLFSLSMLEQLSINGGNFLFFIISAKLVGPFEFGKFSILWMGTQIIISISIPWIALPITSKGIDLENKAVILNALKKIVYLSFLSPLLLIIYVFLIEEKIGWFEVVMMYFLGICLVLFDGMRFFLVRNRAVKKAFFCNILKWILAFLTLGFLFLDHELSKYSVLILGIMLGTFVGVIVQFYFTRSYYFKLKDKGSSSERELDMSLFHLGISNLSNSVLTTILLTKVNLIVFGALQAFRSLINIYPFILQYIESHFSAELIAKKKTSFISRKMIFIYTCFSLILMLVFSYYGEFIIKFIYGLDYVEYWKVFIFLFGIVSIQSLSRLVNIQNRLQNKNNVFNHSAIVLWFSTLIYAYLYVRDSKVDYYFILWIMLVTAIAQLFLYLNMIRNKFNEKKYPDKIFN